MKFFLLLLSLFLSLVCLSQSKPAGTLDKPISADCKTPIFITLDKNFTYGLTVLTARNGRKETTLFFLGITFLLGCSFVVMEVYEFHKLYLEGNTWQLSAALSSFFTLVGTHGLHVSFGLLWMIVLFFQLNKHGITDVTKMKINCLSLFWHFLDIVWIFVFSIVYLIGVL